MKKQKPNRLILITLLIILCIVLIFLYKTPQKNNLNSKNSTPPCNITTQIQEKNNSRTTTLLINKTKYESRITNQINVYEFMIQLRDEGQIYFKEKNYSGMGEFIEEINNQKNNGEKNWIYYVNDKKANIGISNYKINPGDVVSWKYETSY
jgi:hypothetical protein